MDCESNCGRKAAMKRPKTGGALCQPCFFAAFESEVHSTIVKGQLFRRGDYVAIGASGGKDSTVLAYVLKLLNQRHDYGLRLVLLSVDEGITGYRDDSLETVKRNEIEYQLPLKILSYKELYGWTMDEIVREVGRKNNCTFCGVFRRQALDRGAVLLGVNKIVTGHNADDVAETILMNLLRGDVARLQRCTAITTGSEDSLPRCKPFKYTYEKEIVMYAYFKKLDYFSTECIYSPNAYRGHVRTLIKDLERIRPSAIVDIIYSGESLAIRDGVKMPTQGVCSRCDYISSMPICKACVMLEGLNKGLPRLGVGKSSKVKGHMESLQDRDENKNGGCLDGVAKEKVGCCGGGNKGGCSKEEGVKCGSDAGDNESILRVRGRRSREPKKPRGRAARIDLGDNAVKEETDFLNNNGNESIEGTNLFDEGLDEFFGCGGFSSIPTNSDIQDDDDMDDVGTLPSKINLQNHPDMDIENLGTLAATMLHLSGNLGGSARGKL